MSAQKSSGHVSTSSARDIGFVNNSKYNEDGNNEELLSNLTAPQKHMRTDAIDENAENSIIISAYSSIGGRRLSRFQRLVTGPQSKIYMTGISRAAKSAKGKVPKRDYGKLIKFLDTPLEVFVEVASYLHPLDILNLSRATRALRNILMSKHSQLVWKVARNSISMPECPSGLSEPQYVNLVFGRDCDACGAPKVQYALFDLRIRLCSGCMDLNILPGVVLAKQYGDYATDENLYSLVPYDRYAIFKAVNIDIDTLSRHFLKPDFEDAALMYISLSSDPDRRETFLKERKKIIEECYHFAISIQQWTVKNKNEKKQENESIAENRAKQIFKNLRDLGYTDDDLYHTYDIHTDEWERCLNQNRPLTPLIWKNVRPKMERIIRERNTVKKACELQQSYADRRLEICLLYMRYMKERSSDSEDDIFLKPGFADVLCCPAALELIQQDEGSKNVTEEIWQPLRDSLPDLYSATQQSMRDKCYAVLCEAYTSVGPIPGFQNSTMSEEEWKDSCIRLASSIFTLGGNLGMYPVIFKSEIDEDKMHDTIQNPEKYLWTEREISCHSSRINMANRLLTALGLPLSTPSSYVLNFKYECLRCESEIRRKLNWVEYVLHFEKENRWYDTVYNRLEELRRFGRPTDIMAILDHAIDGFEPPAKMLAEERSTERPPDPVCNSFCSLCSELGLNMDLLMMSDSEVKAHIRRKHGITLVANLHYRERAPVYDSDESDDIFDVLFDLY